MTAPALVSLTDDGTGDSLTAVIDYGMGVAKLDLLYREVGATAWSTVTEDPAASPVSITGLTDGVLYEALAVGYDSLGDLTLPSLTLRAVPRSSAYTVRRRIERDVVATIGAITTVGGHFDDMARVWRFEYPVDVTGQKGMFAIVAFPNTRHEQLAQRGTDAVDDCHLTVEIGIGREGRDGTEGWIADSENDMLAALQVALMEDPTRGGLAIDTVHVADSMRDEERMTDATVAMSFEIHYRTMRRNPYRVGV